MRTQYAKRQAPTLCNGRCQMLVLLLSELGSSGHDPVHPGDGLPVHRFAHAQLCQHATLGAKRGILVKLRRFSAATSRSKVSSCSLSLSVPHSRSCLVAFHLSAAGLRSDVRGLGLGFLTEGCLCFFGRGCFVLPAAECSHSHKDQHERSTSAVLAHLNLQVVILLGLLQYLTDQVCHERQQRASQELW